MKGDYGLEKYVWVFYEPLGSFQMNRRGHLLNEKSREYIVCSDYTIKNYVFHINTQLFQSKVKEFFYESENDLCLVQWVNLLNPSLIYEIKYKFNRESLP